jgi:predicted amidohydrolase
MSAPTEDLRVSLVQGDTRWHDPAANRAYYGELIADLRGETDLIVLPETFTSGFSNEALARAEGMDGPTAAWIRERAQELGAVVTGSIQCRTDSGVVNRLLWAAPDGSVRHYDKRHLFRMAGEHERYAAGRTLMTPSVRGWRVRPLVCYDLRFPVFIRQSSAAAAADGFDYDLLLFVANWPEVRRHPWRTLLMARAIENLACAVGVNRVGTDGNGVVYSGDSAVIDGAGERLLELGAAPEVATATLSAEALSAHRQRFPAHRDADRFRLESD